MRRLRIGLIVFLSGIMVCLCVVLGIGLTADEGFWNRFGIHIDGINVERRNYSLVLEKKIPVEDIRSLKINYDMTFNDVLIYQGTGEDVIVREYMNFEPEDRQISNVEQNDTTLEVRGVRRNFFSFWRMGAEDAYTEIYLPADLAGNLDDVSVKTVSGSILSEIPLMQTGAFGVSTTSGDVLFPDVRAKRIQAHSTSGNVRLASAVADDLDVSTTSGDIVLDQAEGDAVISSTSGSIRLWALDGQSHVTTTSGDISLGQMKGDMTLSTTSGNIRIQEGLGSLDAASVSGDIRTDSLEGAFRMKTTSGTLAVSQGRGYGKASSVSGDIQIFLSSLNGNLDISTTSGAVGLRLPEASSFAFHFVSTSGECKTFFDEALSFSKKGNKADGQYGNGGGSIDVSTSSGDLSVARY